jgi:dTDP-4-dehydrorhamnose reductase
VTDQIGGPTAADDIAAVILDIIAFSTAPDFRQWGTYHFSGAPAVSWFEFAKIIVAHRGVAVLPIATQDYPLPARRPSNSVLDCSRIYSVFGVVQPDWRIALRNVLNELQSERGSPRDVL